MTRRAQAGLVTLTLALLTVAVLPSALRGDAFSFEVYRELAVGVLFVVAGLLGWSRRPTSAVGKLLTVAGLVWLLARALVWAGTNPVVFSAGLVLVLLPIAFLAHLAVGFPSGRVTAPLERFVVVSSYVVIIAGVAFLDLSGCPDCPRNLLAVPPEGLGRWLRALVLVATLGAITAFCAVLVGHWRRGSRAARRVLAPVLPPALVYAAVSAANILSELGAPVGLGRQWLWVEDVAILAVPVAFLGGLLRSRLVRYGVGELVVELGISPTAVGGELRSAVSRALGDPSVEIAYWVRDLDGYVDASGRPIGLPIDDSDRAVTVITRSDERIGALVHDPALREEPALLDAVCAAAGLAMENKRLHAEVLARLAEVSASRARIVEAADAERRRVERNLHDGAQQRLVTLSLALTMARSRLAKGTTPSEESPGSHVGELLSEAAEELVQALRELRELGRGIHPAILTEEGLDAALQSLAERSPVPVEISAHAGAPLPQPVEAAAYYVVSEALANVAKYADASTVKVIVERCERSVLVEVADDGMGGAVARPGSGLEGLGDRVAALNGRLVVDSPPGQGTRVRAEIPCG